MIKLNKNVNGFDYATVKRTFYIKKENNKYLLFNQYEVLLKEYDKLKEVKEAIEQLEKLDTNLNQPLFALYVDRLKDTAKFYEIIEEKESEKEVKSLINKCEMFIKKANELGYIITKSPYGASFYAHEEHIDIKWGYKPINSLRIADHWNFGGGKHCVSNCRDNEHCVCIYTKEGYKKLFF